VTYCPQDAVKISIENPETFTEAVKMRIESYIKVA
jgi:hypothetical protein